MTIGTNTAVNFFGDQDNLDSTSALVASNGFSIVTDLVSWTNDDDAPEAAITVELTMKLAANDNSGVTLYFRALNVESTNDDMVPEFEHQHTFMGFWPVLNGITTLQRSTKRVALPNYKTSSVWEVYMHNNTGQEIDAGWTVFITPVSIGPHA